jgi:hypothetical protein
MVQSLQYNVVAWHRVQSLQYNVLAPSHNIVLK